MRLSNPDSSQWTRCRRRANVHSVTKLRREDLPVKRGLYRLIDPILGEAARVHKTAGDAAPYLSRFLYELLEFEPEFENLPTIEEHRRHARVRAAKRQSESTLSGQLVG